MATCEMAVEYLVVSVVTSQPLFCTEETTEVHTASGGLFEVTKKKRKKSLVEKPLSSSQVPGKSLGSDIWYWCTLSLHNIGLALRRIAVCQEKTTSGVERGNAAGLVLPLCAQAQGKERNTPARRRFYMEQDWG